MCPKKNLCSAEAYMSIVAMALPLAASAVPVVSTVLRHKRIARRALR